MGRSHKRRGCLTVADKTTLLSNCGDQKRRGCLIVARTFTVLPRIQLFFQRILFSGILRLKNIPEKSDSSHFQIKKVDGCLRMENNDNLWDLDFLNETDFSGCDDQHVFKMNRHFCPKWYYWNSKPLQITGPDVYGCGWLFSLSLHFFSSEKRCWDLAEGQCTTFYGDLVITDEFDSKLVERLEVIRGRLIIKNTSLKQIELPRLHLTYGRNSEHFFRFGTHSPIFYSLTISLQIRSW